MSETDASLETPQRVYKNSHYNDPEKYRAYLGYMKDRYVEKRDVIVAQKRQHFDCQLCGGRYSHDHRAAHFKTKKHINAQIKAQHTIQNLTHLLQTK